MVLDSELLEAVCLVGDEADHGVERSGLIEPVVRMDIVEIVGEAVGFQETDVFCPARELLEVFDDADPGLGDADGPFDAYSLSGCLLYTSPSPRD